MVGYDAGRKKIIYRSRLSEEWRSVTREMINAWLEASLPTPLSNYDLKDNYNADEFGLFYQCLANKT